MISGLHGGWAPGIHLTKMGSIINLRGMHCHVSELTIHGAQDATRYMASYLSIFIHHGLICRLPILKCLRIGYVRYLSGCNRKALVNRDVTTHIYSDTTVVSMFCLL